jgi:hypothetical protein
MKCCWRDRDKLDGLEGSYFLLVAAMITSERVARISQRDLLRKCDKIHVPINTSKTTRNNNTKKSDKHVLCNEFITYLR